MSDKQYRLGLWLRDAHAMEQQAETMLKAQSSRLEHYPELRARIDQHVRETQSQISRVEECIKRVGTDSSALKDMAGSLTATMQGLGGMFAGDEVLKGSMASFAFENLEASGYLILAVAAEEAGDQQTAAVCREIMEEELAMASWIKDHLPDLTRAFLSREEADLTAKR
ncbi:ferritin-like domain-containing protein [Consotaella salsifontis]|uniref:Ferritin-like metal-binding protein YciE n=1 Tax=Consotaella salsifontis TaxID=1365950 RepID=A0A1T4RA11_9HYPH|nr:ferritin-like domain-containing protein [Consotaella salsifontis]SKA12910.1 Ferritin-like metal-binding protein YciE [Consotaella salsifontis]